MVVSIFKDQNQQLQNKLFFLHTKDLEIKIRLALIENKPSSSIDWLESIPISQDKPSCQKFVSTIDCVNFQKWYIYITLKIKGSFGLKTITLFNNGTDQNCIKKY